jgi:RimJ/RimL family protein N-acetyltransferase
MIRRVLDPDIVNTIANEGSVREMMFLGMTYPLHDLDFSDCIENQQNVCLIDNKGFCSIFQWSAPGVYECHIMAPKAARGVSCMASAHEMLAFMKQMGARMVWGRPSIYNRAAICFIRRMGLKAAGFGQDAAAGDVQYFVTEDL